LHRVASPIDPRLRRGIIANRSGLGGASAGGIGSSPVDCASAGNMAAPWGSVVYVCPV